LTVATDCKQPQATELRNGAQSPCKFVAIHIGQPDINQGYLAMERCRTIERLARSVRLERLSLRKMELQFARQPGEFGN
jgi:hypothetical protein